MKKLKVTKREALLLIILGIATVGYVIYSYLVAPNQEKLAAVNTELAVKSERAAKLDEHKQTLEQLQKKVEKDKALVETLETKLPTHKKTPELLVYFDKKLREHQLEFHSVAFGELDLSNEFYGVFSINLSFEGKHDAILSFIKMLENDNRKFVIDSFSLQPSSRNKAIPFSLSFKAYVLRGEGDITQEHTDYDFLRGNLGKEYPFAEVKEESPVQLQEEESKETDGDL